MHRHQRDKRSVSMLGPCSVFMWPFSSLIAWVWRMDHFAVKFSAQYTILLSLVKLSLSETTEAHYDRNDTCQCYFHLWYYVFSWVSGFLYWSDELIITAFNRSEVAASMLSLLPSSGNLTRIPRLIKTVYHVGDGAQAFSMPIYKTSILVCTSNKTCTPTPTWWVKVYSL